MMCEVFPENNVANRVNDIVVGTSFGNDFIIAPITTQDFAAEVKRRVLIDMRAKTEPTSGYGQVYEGVSFDQNNVRSQAYAICEKATYIPIAVSTIVIANRNWIEQQRYFEKVPGGVRVISFPHNAELPDYLIIPAWTNVDKKYLLHFAIPGFRMYRAVLNFLQEIAPNNTFMEAIAQGNWPSKSRRELTKMVERGVGTYISEEETPFPLDWVGLNSKGSSSSVKIAPLLGLKKANNVGSAVSLGPTFAKKVK